MAVIRADRGRVVPWRNGLGNTTELVRVPDRDDWSWRLSVASSDRPAAFSTYDGVDRELLVLSGVLDLHFGDGVTRLSPHESHRFVGEAPVCGAPLGGATEQLNLMWRRDVLQAELVLGTRATGSVTVAGLGIEVSVRIMTVDAPGQTSPVRKHGR